MTGMVIHYMTLFLIDCACHSHSSRAAVPEKKSQIVLGKRTRHNICRCCSCPVRIHRNHRTTHILSSPALCTFDSNKRHFHICSKNSFYCPILFAGTDFVRTYSVDQIVLSHLCPVHIECIPVHSNRCLVCIERQTVRTLYD